MMDFVMADAIQMIGELYYQKRMLETELETAKSYALGLLTDKQTAEEKLAELEASLNGHKEEAVERSESV